MYGNSEGRKRAREMTESSRKVKPEDEPKEHVANGTQGPVANKNPATNGSPFNPPTNEFASFGFVPHNYSASDPLHTEYRKFMFLKLKERDFEDKKLLAPSRIEAHWQKDLSHTISYHKRYALSRPYQ